jgi:hypothetical protein
MPPTTERGAASHEDKRAARIPSLVADLASADPAVRTKACEALVAIGELSVPYCRDYESCLDATGFAPGTIASGGPSVTPSTAEVPVHRLFPPNFR